MTRSFLTIPLICLLVCSNAVAQNWPSFRGPNRRGIAEGSKIPLKWDESTNVKWTVDLPGRGSSSPIVWGDRIFLTGYSGTGTDMKRQLVCLKKTDGKIVWSRDVPAAQPEDNYRGYITEHGYASNTPTTDGELVYAFFGKSGVFAFDFDGNQKWRVEVGKESSNRRWGSAASPVIVGDMLIVNASEESQSIRCLNKRTGQQIWKQEAAMLELSYSTPVFDEKRNELIVAVPGEVWGMSLKNGALNWYAATRLTGNVSPSPQIDDDKVYLFGGYQSSGSHAFKLGGKDDASSNQHWYSRTSSYVATPLLYNGHFYWINDRGIAYCTKQSDGTVVYQERVAGLSGGGRPIYASPVVANGRIYVVTRKDGCLVLPAEPRFEILARNKIAGASGDASATPAISGDEMFLRAGTKLYCVAGE